MNGDTWLFGISIVWTCAAFGALIFVALAP